MSTNDAKKQTPDEVVEGLRASARDEMEAAPTIGKGKKSAKEIKVKRSPWIVRGLIVLLVALLIVEGLILRESRREALSITIQNPPPVESSPVPEIHAPLPPPPIEGSDEEEEDLLPEPTPIPLPSELGEIEFPEGGE